jgi:hypothetical protein
MAPGRAPPVFASASASGHFMMHPRARALRSLCNVTALARGQSARKVALSAGGTSDAVHRSMKDIIFLAVTVGFFAVSWLYTKSLDRL